MLIAVQVRSDATSVISWPASASRTPSMPPTAPAPRIAILSATVAPSQAVDIVADLVAPTPARLLGLPRRPVRSPTEERSFAGESDSASTGLRRRLQHSVEEFAVDRCHRHNLQVVLLNHSCMDR